MTVPPPTRSTSAAAATTTYQYDPLGKRIQTAAPLGSVTSSQYDASGNRISSTDPRGNVTTYDANSNAITASYPNGLQSTNFTYDTLDRLTALASPVSSYTYQRDPTGNLTSATELSDRTLNWSYDGIYRLTNEIIASDPAHENGSISYGLDPVGNNPSVTG